jgi:NDP-mannose synthase
MSNQAVIIAGGKGTRLHPMTQVVPKPLLCLGDISIIEVIISQLARYEFKDIIILLGYKPELIQAVVGDGRKWGINIRYAVEKEPLGTVGGLKLIADMLEPTFLVVNADILTTLNFRRVLDFHHLGEAVATIGAVRRLEQIHLGVLDVDQDYRVIDFREKPPYHFLAVMGVHAFVKPVLNYIPAGKPFSLDELLFRLLSEKVEVRAFAFSGIWLDLGRWDDLERAVDMFGKAREQFIPIAKPV